MHKILWAIGLLPSFMLLLAWGAVMTLAVIVSVIGLMLSLVSKSLASTILFMWWGRRVPKIITLGKAMSLPKLNVLPRNRIAKYHPPSNGTGS